MRTILCKRCLALGFGEQEPEVLTIGILGPADCVVCGLSCRLQGQDFDVVRAEIGEVAHRKLTAQLQAERAGT